MVALWFLLVLSLCMGELLYPSGLGSLPTNTIVLRTYPLALRFEGTTPPANLPEAGGGGVGKAASGNESAEGEISLRCPLLF